MGTSSSKSHSPEALAARQALGADEVGLIERQYRHLLTHVYKGHPKNALVKMEFVALLGSNVHLALSSALFALLSMPPEPTPGQGHKHGHFHIHKPGHKHTAQPQGVSCDAVIVAAAALTRGSDSSALDYFWRMLDAAGTGEATRDTVRTMVAAITETAALKDWSKANAAFLDAVVQGLMGDKPTLSRAAFQEGLRKQLPGAIRVIRDMMSCIRPDASAPRSVLPSLRLPPDVASLDACVLSQEWIWALSSQLPAKQREVWELLYTSNTHGQSFNTFMGACACQGPVLIIIKDTEGHVFGGFASQMLEKNGSFYGDHSAFVFSMEPAFNVYHATGFNENFQWCGHQFKTLPNGVGWGGQHKYYGLYVDGTFEAGMSRSVATYRNPCLASAETFKVDSVEAWLVEQLDPDDIVALAKAGRMGQSASALDQNVEDQAIMQMSGMAVGASAAYRGKPAEPICD